MCNQIITVELPDGSSDYIRCSNSGTDDDCTIREHETHSGKFWWSTDQQ